MLLAKKVTKATLYASFPTHQVPAGDPRELDLDGGGGDLKELDVLLLFLHVPLIGRRGAVVLIVFVPGRAEAGGGGGARGEQDAT